MPRGPKLSDDPARPEMPPDSDAQDDRTDVSGAETPGKDSVARRAYERFEARGGEHGRDQEDWFEAERDLNNTERG
jgi:hypothetical protein